MAGRENELGALDRLLDAVSDGEKAVVMLSGEPGIGKTTLIAHALRAGGERGYAILSGRAAEFERGVPFATFVDALESDARVLALRGDLCDGDLALLAHVFPALSSKLVGSRRRAQPDERHRLLRAMQGLFDLVAAERPLLLALDDLHWADPASIDLLCRLLHRGVAGPSLVMLASRRAHHEPRLRAALHEAERHGQALEIALAPLSRAEADALFDPELHDRARDEIYVHSGGNPLYIQQLAASSRRGTPILGSEPGSGPAEADVPAAISAAIGEEIDRLSAPAQALLKGAAVFGETFDFDPIAETAGVDGEDAFGALDELVRNDLIRVADSSRRFRFRHPIVRHAVYEAAGAGWRLAAHARAAAALESRGASGALRAPHLERSARLGDQAAAAVLVEAAQEAAGRAPDSAARWFDAALRLTPAREDNLELRLHLRSQRADALALAGHVRESRDVWGEFLSLSSPQPSEQRSRAVTLFASLHHLLGCSGTVQRWLLDELARLPEEEVCTAGALKSHLAASCFFMADWAGMGNWSRQALAGTCSGIDRLRALAARAFAELTCNDVQQVRRSLDEAAELFNRLGDREILDDGGAAILLGWAEVRAERSEDAVRHLRRWVAIQDSAGQKHLTLVAQVALGQALLQAGRVHELTAVAEAATDTALLSVGVVSLGPALTLRCGTSLLAGDLQGAIRLGEQAVALSASTYTTAQAAGRLWLGAALLASREPARCRALLVGPDGKPTLSPEPVSDTGVYELLMGSELMLGRLDRAEDLAARAERASEACGLELPRVRAGRMKALLSLSRGEPRAAATHAFVALEAARRARAALDIGRSRTIAGVALAAAGDRAAAIEELELAHEELVSCGTALFSDEASRALRQLGRRVPGPALGTGFSLTPRELEVIESIGQGRTNRQIAEALVLSVRTVDRHVARIFDKLDVNSRAAATSVFERSRPKQSLRP